MSVKYCLFLLLILPTKYLSGQFDISALDTIEVKTSRIPVKLKEAGRFITVLDADQIKSQAALSVDELLRYTTGVEVQSRNAFGAQSDISLRGSTFTQVLVLIDGMRLTDPLTAHFNGYIPIPTPEIQRIEILRGPAAASFGPDAVGGVINIITKTFGSHHQEKSFSGEVNVNYGEEDLVHSQAGISWQNEKGMKLSLAGSINESDGQLFEAQQIFSNDDTTNLSAYRNFFDIKNITLGLHLPLSKDWQLSFRSAYDYRDFSARYFYTSSPFDLSVETTTNLWNHIRFSNIQANGTTTIDAAYKRNTDEFIFNPAFTGNNHTTNLLNFQFNHYRIINDKWRWNAGFQADERRIESNDRGNHQDWHFGGFVSGAYQLNDWNLLGSLRLDQDENYGLEFSPQLNIALTKPTYILRSTIGRSIRAADYTERYVSNNLQNLTPGRNLGNPDLNAESSWSAELGVDWLPSSIWRLSMTTFLRLSDQLIDYTSTNSNEIANNENLSPNANYFYARNIEDVQTYGFEIESLIDYPLSDQSALMLKLGYTFLNTANDSDIISVYISNHAKHLLTSNLNLRIQQFNLSLNGLWKVRNELLAPQINSTLEDQYMVWHLKAGYQLSPSFGLNFQVHNLFDEQYQDILGAPMPNRWFLGGIHLSW